MQLSLQHAPSRRMSIVLLIVLLLSGLFLVGASTLVARNAQHIGAKSFKLKAWSQASPPDYASCEAKFQQPCYSPQEIQNAYSVTPLLKKDITGEGQTIVIIDSFGSPTALADLQKFDAAYGLPDPPSFKVLAPLGSVPFDYNNNDELGWAEETSLDVQWSHALAPGANIVLLTSPVSETEGVQGMPEFLKLEQYAVNHHLGKIISQSWGATEETLFTPEGKKVFKDFEAFYREAAEKHITVFASAGDGGVLNGDVNNNNYPFPTVIYPASSPWVTAVGGTSLYTDSNGTYQKETVWNGGLGDATGGGVSKYFKEPDYQEDNLPSSDNAILKGYRAIPDIAYNADPATAVPVYLSFLPTKAFYLFGGTSEGAPQWAGLIADANQAAGHALGFLNDKLYRLGHNSSESAESFHDITVGNNSQAPVTGYSATPGWDPVTGWGTPIADELVEELA